MVTTSASDKPLPVVGEVIAITPVSRPRLGSLTKKNPLSISLITMLLLAKNGYTLQAPLKFALLLSG